MSIGSFVHAVESDVSGAARHVVNFVEKEAPKLEKFIVEVETFVGSNAVAKQFLQPVINNLDSLVTAEIAKVRSELGSGATIEQVISEVKRAVPALVDAVKSTFLAQVQQAGGHASVLDSLLNAAYLAIGPKLGSLVAALLPAAGESAS